MQFNYNRTILEKKKKVQQDPSQKTSLIRETTPLKGDMKQGWKLWQKIRQDSRMWFSMALRSLMSNSVTMEMD